VDAERLELPRPLGSDFTGRDATNYVTTHQIKTFIITLSGGETPILFGAGVGSRNPPREQNINNHPISTVWKTFTITPFSGNVEI
tara:strand:+ start:1829 stop:2083 length:255 start_codon:yes stop_codon:yes gene_type:complete